MTSSSETPGPLRQASAPAVPARPAVPAAPAGFRPGDTARPPRAFTPAAGRFAPTSFYDPVAALVRERLWRGLLAMHVAPRPEEVIVDVGCGTGSQALLLHDIEPAAHIVGIDPDPRILAVARRKARSTGAAVDWRQGMGDEVAELLGAGSADTAVSSLVLHQCPLPMKRAILAALHTVLRPGGRLVLADYGLQRTRLMRTAFRVVQFADGRADTQPNADGILPSLVTEAGFDRVREAEVVSTVTGSISVYVARRAGD
ncbi:SAM-dependent methyltransferase [Streptomyces venezuelae]|uniref:SAM-dependent methyltransferase n=1 Tax=Streptomyces venezuelae TaxID=54571 RepID=A0A5P2DD13_STRVZ|nr:class I SAM-dependent methyltransferase [Streptomyces venezuelae]QES52976.1 SAM-dependent methyltransferase [Streptomyces venezuelae]